MTIRVCFATMREKVMSIGGLREDEFQQRISETSHGDIKTIFILRENETNKHRSTKFTNIISLKKINLLPACVSYSVICFKNLHVLMKQDIIVAPSVELEGFFVCLFCKLLRKKSMLTIHGHYDEEWKTIRHLSKLSHMVVRASEKFTLRFADMIVVNDEQIKDNLVRKGVNPTRISIRYLFADTEMFSRKNICINKFHDIKSQFKLPDKYILFVGHLDEWDGITDMLEVFKKIHTKLPAYKCVLVGDAMIEKDSSKSRMVSFIAKNNLNNEIIQTGKVDHSLMPYFYFGSDLVILPLHPPQAGVGRITVEALSMEVPVVITDIGAFHCVVINNKTGFRIPLGNLNLMASKSIYLLENSNLRSEFGSNGRKLVKINNDIYAYIDNWVKSITQLSES